MIGLFDPSLAMNVSPSFIHNGEGFIRLLSGGNVWGEHGIITRSVGNIVLFLACLPDGRGY